MKKAYIIILALLIASALFAQKNFLPSRYSFQVDDVYEAYAPDDWIISPKEEPVGDNKSSQVAECDIRGIISCYDADDLRVDMLLENPISYSYRVFYAVEFEYTKNDKEYYTYYPDNGDFIYELEENGVITKKEALSRDDGDYATVTNSGDEDNTDVLIVINKDSHISGEIGSTYYLTTKFYAGYIDKNDKMFIADQTIPVKLFFVK